MATHLAASMRVVAAHEHRRFASVADTRDAILVAAGRRANGQVDAETERLIARLEKVTGATLAELEAAAKSWSDA